MPQTNIADRENTERKGSTFPFVGLGASAGGLEALKAFFAEVPENSGMAYFVVVHRSPDQPSMLPDLLQKVSFIPVTTAEDDRPVQSNHAYVVPSNKDIAVFSGRIKLLERNSKAATLSIDLFLRSLAEDQGKNSAVVILYGTGSDGTMGVRAIKAAEGLVLVQSVETAAYDGMPRSAIDTGLADFILPPEKMPEQLMQYFASHRAAFKPENDKVERDDVDKIFSILRSRIGHDFSDYKDKTIQRRISRRMVVNQIDSHKEYVDYLQKNPNEAETLFRELLIGVTQFFRDAQAFEVLKTEILPEYLESLKDGDTFRAWIPGCSTGEEVYSLAMILHECLDQISRRINLQLFGTDIDGRAITLARKAVYPDSIRADVGAERLKRFFVKEDDTFRVRKELRDDLVFSEQNILRDPPFLRLNLLSCRNLLIYLNNEAQKKLIPLFHYSMVPHGILLLGPSETISRFSSLFKARNKKWRIYLRREVTSLQPVEFPSRQILTAQQDRTPTAAEHKRNVAESTRKAIIDQFAPTAILVDFEGNIKHVQGRTGKYLETPSGAPTSNILNLARNGLRIELSAAIRKAVSSKIAVTRRNIGVRTNGDMQMINLHVAPQHSGDLKDHLLVVLVDIDDKVSTYKGKTESSHEQQTDSSRITELEEELLNYQENHKVTIEELESANEELKSTNEELQSANEELQSANEEQESTKEELQSLNEELQTVNAELESKVAELSEAHDDLRNLLNGTQIATIFVNNELRIRRFTEEATTIINLIQSDIGRPLKHVVTNLEYADVIDDLTGVIQKLTPKTAEVKTIGGDWYAMRILPYRTRDNRIDGAVLTFSDINEQKKAQVIIHDAKKQAEGAWQLVRYVFDMNSSPIAVLDKNDKLVIANSVFSTLFNISQKEVRGLDLINLQHRVFKGIDLQPMLAKALEQKSDFTSPVFEIHSTDGNRGFFIHGRIIREDDDFPYHLLLHFRESPAKD